MKEAVAKEVVIVGAGLAGSLGAIFFARRGFSVRVYERRPDYRQGEMIGGRSINLGLSARGIQALRAAGVIDTVLAKAVAMRGRMVHSGTGAPTFQPYGKSPSEVLYSIERSDLTRALLARADSFGNLAVLFDRALVGLDKESRELTFRHDRSGEIERVAAPLVIGADGAFSLVRERIHARERANFSQEYAPWGYKELTLPAGPDGRSRIALEALHVWPRRDALMVSHPNVDGSHTLSLFLPFEGGPRSFEHLRSEAEVRALFAELFPDLAAQHDLLCRDFLAHPTGRLITIKTSPWHFQDWVLLVGDACHAVYPFYGQGMNSALEDLMVLDRIVDSHGSQGWEAVFREQERQRKTHTDTLSELSKENFWELSTHVQSPLFLFRKKLDVLLNRLLPGVWVPLYTMVSHTTVPYAEAVARARRQERRLRWAGLGILVVLVVLTWIWMEKT